MNKMTLKILHATALTAALSMTTTAVYAAEYEIRLGHVTSNKEPIQEAMEVFAKRVAERTDGQVEISIFPNGTLGTNAEVYEQLRAGAPVMTIAEPGYLSDYVADYGVLGGPYLVDEPSDLTKILESELYEDMKQQVKQKAGIEVLAQNWLFGKRHMISDRPISSPNDIKGMTFRTLPNKMWVETFEAMGTRPTQLAWAEVYSGLSAGVVEGAEAPLASIHSAKLHEVKDVISLTGHFTGFTGLSIGADYFSMLPSEIQTVLSEEALSAGRYMTDLVLESNEEWEEKLESEGVSIHRNVDIDAFRTKTRSVYKQFPEWSDGLYERIREILAQ